jgi:hypothetical protein
LLTRSSLITAAGAGLVIIATAALAGCGQASAGGTNSGHSGTSARRSQLGVPMRLAPVCVNPAGVRSVRVTRLPTRAQLGQAKPMPAKAAAITISDRSKARALARLVCGLPVMPHGVFHCPVAIGGGYQLQFKTADGLRFPAVTVRASGCETVSGAGGNRVRWVARSPAFWPELARLTGIRAPAHTP